MTRKATDVASYIQEVPAERRAALATLRSLCQKNLPGYQEVMAFGMPGYRRNGSLELSFASQKQYLAQPTVVNQFRGQLAAASLGKRCIRFKKPPEIDSPVIAKLLRRTEATPSRSC